jgi:hypothetical protein
MTTHKFANHLMADQAENSIASASLRVLSGMHTGAVLALSAPSMSLGPDAGDDMILLDAGGGRLTFDFDVSCYWRVTPESGVLTVGESSVPPYEQFELTTPRCVLDINGVQLEFIFAKPLSGDHKTADGEKLTQTPTGLHAWEELSTQHPVRTYVGAGFCVCAVVIALTIFIPAGDRAVSPQMLDSARVTTTPSKTRNTDLNAPVRQQVADYLNAFRWPVSILNVSDMKIDLVWSGVDALPSHVRRQIGPVLFGRMVEWSDSAEAINVAETSVSANTRERRLNPNRGNRHTEDTLRSYGLMDIASVSAPDTNPRFVLTRAGHRIYEGSELKNGAKLAAVSATELMVQASGSTWLVPYDVSKPVRRVANSFTAIAQYPTQNPNFPQAISSNTPQTVNGYLVGTPIAVVSMPRGKGIESELVGQSK